MSSFRQESRTSTSLSIKTIFFFTLFATLCQNVRCDFCPIVVWFIGKKTEIFGLNYKVGHNLFANILYQLIVRFTVLQQLF